MSIDQIYQIPTHAHNLIDFQVGEQVIDKYSNVNYEVIGHKQGVTQVRRINSGIVDDYNSCNNKYFYPLSFIHPAVWMLIL